MAFTAKDVAALREKTGCGMMDCKKALQASDGDGAKAIEFLREKGLAAAAKKASRIAAEGVIALHIDNEKQIGVIIEVNSETDFVARNDEFRALVTGAAKAVAEYAPETVEALLECKFEDTTDTVADVLREKILKIGENMNIRRFVRVEGFCAGYVHGGGASAALVKIEGDAAALANDAVTEMGKNIGMQIVAMTPAYLNPEAVPAEVVESEKQILISKIKNDPKMANKPEQVIEKMVAGKINKYYQENCLLNQAYVKEPKQSVADYIAEVSKAVGAELKVTQFVAYEKGEGLQKREDNFADEVASMIK